MNVGLFIDTFFPMVDGVIMVVDNYARRLTKYCNVTVFCPKFSGKDYDDSKLPYKVVRCSSIPSINLDYSIPTPGIDISFMNQLKKSNLDLVHIHSPFMLGKLGVNYAKKKNIPVVATLHSQFKKDFYRSTKSETITNILLKNVVNVFNQCSETWAVNSAISDIFYEDYGVKVKPKVSNNATDMLPLTPNEKLEAVKYIKNKYNITEEENIFLFVGRINILKNILFIVDSLKILKDKNIPFKMLFVGTGNDEKSLKDHIIEHNLEDDIILCGKIMDRKELAKHYASAKLFLFPSLYDASSIVQIEAASQGTPTIFIEGSATSATVSNYVNGFIAPNNHIDFANTIEKILNDSDLYNKVSKNAKNDLYISWDNEIENVYNKYLKLINEHV